MLPCVQMQPARMLWSTAPIKIRSEIHVSRTSRNSTHDYKLLHPQTKTPPLIQHGLLLVISQTQNRGLYHCCGDKNATVFVFLSGQLSGVMEKSSQWHHHPLIEKQERHQPLTCRATLCHEPLAFSHLAGKLFKLYKKLKEYGRII